MLYERNLIDYLPQILRNTAEYKAILTHSEQPEIAVLFNCAENALKDQFIADAAENGIKRWESMLKIIPKATYSLEERRFNILTRINEQLPFTLPRLNQLLASLCGKDMYTMSLFNNEYRLEVILALAVKSKYDNVKQLLSRVVPANIIIDLQLLYNRHQDVSKLTHSQLSRYSYEQLRNEVLTA